MFMAKTISIYKISCIKNSKVYIGSSKNTSKRWWRHRDDLENNKHHCHHLQRAWNKYGASCFVFSHIEILDGYSDLTYREQHWIDFYKSSDRKHGFNLSPDAIRNSGRKWTDKQKREQSKRLSGRHLTEETKIKMRDAASGSRSHRATIGENDILNIVGMWNAGLSYIQISDRVGCSKQMVWSIIAGKSWLSVTKHLEIKQRRVHRNSVLNENLVRKIKQDLSNGVMATLIAKEHCVSPNTIYDIKKGRCWEYV
jgi:group I intron endonuclease